MLKNGANGRLMTQAEREDLFRQAYCIKLKAAVEKQPDLFFYTVELVPDVVDKMIDSLKRGNALIGPSMLAAMKTVGAPTKVKAFAAWLNGQ